MTDQNRQALTTLANLGIATHRLDQIRDAARLHRQQLIGTRELYAVIETDGQTPPADLAALRDRIAAAIYERNNPGHRWADAHPDDLVCYGNDADAAMTVLPPPVPRADVLLGAAEVEARPALNVRPLPAEALTADEAFVDRAAFRAAVLREFLSQLDERLLGCCQECNACAAIARDLAAELAMADEAQPGTEAPTNPSWPRRAWDLGLLHKGGDPHHCPACLKQPEPPKDFVCPGAEANAAVLANPQPAAGAQQDGARPAPKPLLTLATPCAVCAHPYNWHQGGVCQAGAETNRCGCIAFAAAEQQDGAQP
ncbi:hypothetical protein [Streptomyces cahuitamycinicus]|uniref:Uncharacterized protein n=1 Tax=Streptomyces cahuitamycinicus TaxID=2070367 RepID=A0A2N8TL39_9ACTN|nr:hypothetical protein [Streptomyces cahuitamycinicus]PNG19745.1 hypothetical protein C1J00_24075 [Streptomyces cahuitamycinicus]